MSSTSKSKFKASRLALLSGLSHKALRHPVTKPSDDSEGVIVVKPEPWKPGSQNF